MVQSKPKKRKKPGSVDFKRVKRRVGRRVQPSQNQTSTAFKAKRVVLKEQAVSPSGHSLAQLLPLLNHHNDAARLSALEHTLAILQGDTPLPNAAFPALVERIMPLLVDTHKPVRVAAVEVTTAVMKQGEAEDAVERQIEEASMPFFPFVKLFMLHVCSALSSIHFATRLDALAFVDMMIVHFPRTLCTDFGSPLVDSLDALLRYCLDNPIGKTAFAAGNARSKRGKPKKAKKIPAIHRVTRSFLRFARLVLEEMDIESGVGGHCGGVYMSESAACTRLSLGGTGRDGSEGEKLGEGVAAAGGLNIDGAVETVARVWEHSIARMGKNTGQRCGDEALLQHLKDVAELGWVCLMISRSKEASLKHLENVLGYFPVVQGRVSDKASKPRVELNGQLSLVALMAEKTRKKAIEWLTTAMNASTGIQPWAIQALRQGFGLDDDDVDVELARAVACKCVALIEDERTEDLVKLVDILTRCKHVEEVAHVLPSIPKTLWKLFDGDTPQNREAKTVLSFAQRLLRRSTSCELFSKRFVSMLYATRKEQNGGVMGPFSTKMSHENQLLALHVAALMGPLNDSFLKALTLNLWMAPEQTHTDVLQTMIDLPFITECEPEQQLSFAMTLLLGKTSNELDAIVVNRPCEETSLASKEKRHEFISERIVQHLSNLAATGILVLSSLAPLIQETVISPARTADGTFDVASVAKFAKTEEIAQRRLDSVGLLCSYLRRVMGDDEVLKTLGSDVAILVVGLYVTCSTKQRGKSYTAISPLHQGVLGVLLKLSKNESNEGMITLTRALSGWCAELDRSEVKLAGEVESDMVHALVDHVQRKCESSGKEFIALAGRLEARFGH